MNTEEIKNLIKDLVERITLQEAKISIADDQGTNTWYAVEVSEPRMFIRQDGEALHALNHLVRRILEAKNPNTPEINEKVRRKDPAILIDINDYQKKRVESIRAVAHMMSERARYFKSNIEVDPMTAFERRIVHEFLADAPDLKTESMGFGPTRHVVIKYIGEI